MTDNALLEQYRRNHWVITKQAEGLDHADSLLELPFRGNCMNRVLGHILVYRDQALEKLGETAVLGAEESCMYEQGSQPITNSQQAVTLERLLDAFQSSQDRISAGLNGTTPETLAMFADQENQRTVADQIAFLIWHETYHVGQLEILRQLAGKDDAII